MSVFRNLRLIKIKTELPLGTSSVKLSGCESDWSCRSVNRHQDLSAEIRVTYPHPILLGCKRDVPLLDEIWL